LGLLGKLALRAAAKAQVSSVSSASFIMMLPHGWRRVALATLALLASVGSSAAIEVDPSSRSASQQFYRDYYLPANSAEIGWTGSHAACDPGTTSPAYRQAQIDRVNYFRAMAGVPAEVVVNETWSAKAQHAALMMSSNNALNHTPPATWMCYTADGAEAAGKSNLSLGAIGPAAVDAYMKDRGAGNTAVGHRRWLLYPQSVAMGAGDVPVAAGRNGANALWVVDNGTFGSPRPATRDTYVAWPPPGYVPFQVTYPRWSFSYPGADFSAATVTVTKNSDPISVSLEPITNGFGENTIAWIPDGMNHAANWPRPAADVAYQVSLSNVVIGGSAQAFSYDVTIFDPDAIAADFDGNQLVDAADLGRWKANFGDVTATKSQGDADGDSDVDGKDLLVWQREVGMGFAAANGLSVPEPDAASFAVVGVALVMAVRGHVGSACAKIGRVTT
jgi:uncharacterized protein YkwD